MYKQTIHKKIFFNIFSLTMLSLIIISLAVYFLFFQTLKKNETLYAVQTSEKTKQNIEFILKLIYNTGTSLASNRELFEELSTAPNINSDEYKTGQNKISTMLQNVISVQEYIKGIYVISPKGNFYTSNWGVKENDLKALYDSYLKNGDTARDYFTSVHPVTYHPMLKSSVISYIRPLFDMSTQKIIGAIIIDIDYDLLKEVFTISSIQNDEKVLVIGPNNECIFTYPYNVILDDILLENPTLLTKEKIQLNAKVFKRNSILVSNTIDYTDWKIIKVIPSDSIHRDTKNLETIAIYVFIIFSLIAIFVSALLSSALSKSIKDLNKKFKLLEKGDLSASITVKGNDEMAELGDSFNKMVIKLKHLINTLLEEQKKKSDMEFQILQAQINPHFLYNTLDSIKWLAVIHNVHTISDMTMALINLLKYNISKKSTTVTLSEEIESVDYYIKIQKYRFGDIFDIQYDIDEETRDCMILRFILQPVVENAILHGFENFEGNGLIQVNSKINGSFLEIEVIDNGSGMDSETLNSIKKNEISKSKFSGIGFQNIQERIKTYFGDEYGLFFESKLNIGTKVTVKLPCNYCP